MRKKVLFCLWVVLPVLFLITHNFTAQTSHAGAKETPSPPSTHAAKSSTGAGTRTPDGTELPRTVRRVDPALFISVEQARARLEQGQAITLLDVRRAEEFANLRIPGSINIRLFALKTKTFLKAEPVVPVGEGSRVCELDEIDREEMFAGSRRQRRVEAKSLFGFGPGRELGISLRDVARRLGMNPAGVGYAVQRGGVMTRSAGASFMRHWRVTP